MLPQIENGYYMSQAQKNDTEIGMETWRQQDEVKSKLHCTSNRIERWMKMK